MGGLQDSGVGHLRDRTPQLEDKKGRQNPWTPQITPSEGVMVWWLTAGNWESARLGSNPGSATTNLLTWASYLNSLCLRLHTHNTGIIMGTWFIELSWGSRKLTLYSIRTRLACGKQSRCLKRGSLPTPPAELWDQPSVGAPIEANYVWRV